MTTVRDLPDLDYVLAEDPPHELTIHSYPRHPAYRLSGAERPQVGDIARCGWVKKHPPVYTAATAPPPTCPQCRRLKAMHR